MKWESTLPTPTPRHQQGKHQDSLLMTHVSFRNPESTAWVDNESDSTPPTAVEGVVALEGHQDDTVEDSDLVHSHAVAKTLSVPGLPPLRAPARTMQEPELPSVFTEPNAKESSGEPAPLLVGAVVESKA